ncbi:MAG: hypothetical protein ABEK16_02690 [Candidatus Nanohalobium sp.]
MELREEIDVLRVLLGLMAGLLIFLNHPVLPVFLIGSLTPALLLGFGNSAYEEGYRKPFLAVLVVYLAFVFLLFAAAPVCQETVVGTAVNPLTGENVSGFEGFRPYGVCPSGDFPWYYME